MNVDFTKELKQACADYRDKVTKCPENLEKAKNLAGNSFMLGFVYACEILGNKPEISFNKEKLEGVRNE